MEDDRTATDPSAEEIRSLLHLADRLAHRLLPHDEAPEAVGEAGVALARLIREGRWSTIEVPEAWVLTIVVRKAASFYERRVRRIEAYTKLNNLRPTGSLVPSDPAEVFDSDVTHLFKVLTWTETRVVVLFREWDSVEDVALALGITSATVLSHLSHARAKVAQELSRQDPLRRGVQ